MKKLFLFIFAMIVLAAIFSKNEENYTSKNKLSDQPAAEKQSINPACDSTSTITGREYHVLGSHINVRQGPGISFPKVINRKATEILKKTQYITIDDTTIVYEECTKNGWSWVRVVEPEWLRRSHKGWVASRFLDKGQDILSDKYARKISSSALLPYTKKASPKTVAKFGSRLKEIEKLRRKAAEMAVDSGKCDYVFYSELSDKKSTLHHLYFWVDCRNKERIYLDEFQIKKSGAVLTEKEKAWDKESALRACKKAIKERALIPNSVDIHTILGTSFYEAPVTHNVVLRMDFDAKNAFGVKKSYTAICHFEPGEVGDIEIKKR